MTGIDYLKKLQAEAKDGFHYKLKAWVHDDSGVARVLREMDNDTD